MSDTGGMKCFKVLAVLNLCAIASVQGHLNASRLDLTEQFGEPSTEKRDQIFGSTEYTFRGDGWGIRAWMLDGRCHMVSYMRSQLPWPTVEQISTFQEMNSAGCNWAKQGVRLTSVTTARKPLSQTHYPRSDRGAYLIKAINGVMFKSAKWQSLEEGTRGRVTEAGRLQSQEVVPKRMPPPSLPKPIRVATNSAARSQTPTWDPPATPQRRESPSSSWIVSLLIFVGAITVFVVVPALSLFVRSSAVKGWIGEKWTFFVMPKGLDSKEYQIFNDLYLPRPDGKGSTQIDHVVLSPFGIFVIETKNFNGWIVGREHDSHWTQQLYHQKFAFQNPLRQNFLHVETLRTLLDLPREAFHSIVFLVGNCEMKTVLPPNVMKSGLRGYIGSFAKSN